MDAAIHFMLEQGTQILVGVSALSSHKSSNAMATGNGYILQQTMTAFIANRAIMGMMEHQPFNYILAKIDRFFISGGYHHAVLGLHHAAHLHPFKRPLQKFHGTHPASAHRSQSWMVTEPRNHDAELFRSFNHLGSRCNFNFSVIDDNFGHVIVRGTLSVVT